MMLFFQRSEEKDFVSFPINGYKNLIIRNIKADRSPTYEDIYVSSIKEFNGHYTHMEKMFPEISLYKIEHSVIRNEATFPCMIGNIEEGKGLFRGDLDTIEVITALHKEKKRKLSIVIYSENRFALGDSMVQASVFKDLYEQIKAKGIDCDFMTYRSLATQANIDNYLSIFPELKIRYLPTSLNNFKSADLILTDAAYFNNFDVDMHEAFAEQLCFKLSESFDVNNTFNYDINHYNKAKSVYSSFNNKNPVLVFNKESSSKLRSMPDSVAEGLINGLLATDKFNIVSFDRLSSLNIEHKNYRLLSSFTLETSNYASFLAASDGLISVDSGPVHLAARLGVPSYSFYTSIDPKIREKYYKKADSLLLKTEHMNKHGQEDLTDEEYLDIWKEVKIEKTVKKLTKKFKKSLF